MRMKIQPRRTRKTHDIAEEYIDEYIDDYEEDMKYDN